MRKGFTLIELLVVIAIIAILAAILFPVFARAREKARQTSCLSNVKQHALGLTMYAQDYDERFPYWNWGQRLGNGGPPGMTMWWGAIYPYVKNVQLFECPSGARDGCHVTCYSWDDPFAGRAISYGYNEYMSNDGRRLAQIQYPAQHLLLGDCRTTLGGNLPGGWLYRYIFVLNDPPACCPPDMAAGRPNADDGVHNGGSNIGFVDGHAKWLACGKLKTSTELYY